MWFPGDRSHLSSHCGPQEGPPLHLWVEQLVGPTLQPGRWSMRLVGAQHAVGDRSAYRHRIDIIEPADRAFVIGGVVVEFDLEARPSGA